MAAQEAGREPIVRNSKWIESAPRANWPVGRGHRSTNPGKLRRFERKRAFWPRYRPDFLVL